MHFFEELATGQPVHDPGWLQFVAWPVLGLVLLFIRPRR